MTTPIRINCESTMEVPSFEKIRMMADSDHHVVLQFPRAQRVDKGPLVHELRAALPEHSVFDSGGDNTTDWVTVMPVIPSVTVLAHAREFGAAVASYIEACSTMLAKCKEGSLSEEWSSAIHGGHRRFENSHTGQVIEAPLGGAPAPLNVDPYFLSLFVKSTPGLEVVAGLLRHSFHDAVRMLDILFGEPGRTQPDVASNDGPPTPPARSVVCVKPPSTS